MIFIYSGLFSADKNNHPIPSIHEKIYGQKAPSSGMSRAFSEIMRGEFQSARDYNPDSLRVFAFFLIQFFLRILVSLLLVWDRLKKKHLLYADVLFSIILLLWSFSGQIRAMFRF